MMPIELSRRDRTIHRALAGIREHGSLRAACADGGVSYTSAWTALRDWSDSHGGMALAESEPARIRGLDLTPAGTALLGCYDEAQAAIELAQQRLERRLAIMRRDGAGDGEGENDDE